MDNYYYINTNNNNSSNIKQPKPSQPNPKSQYINKPGFGWGNQYKCCQTNNCNCKK